MSNSERRDEIKINRLSSFLYQLGKLTVERIVPIKPNVFHVKTGNGEEIILKKHSNKKVVVQQWDFFDNINSSIAVPFKQFPNNKKILESNGRYWTIAPFEKGRKLNYALRDDRIACLTTLHQFHDKAKELYITSPIKKQLFYKRWYNRLLSFRKTEHFFNKYNFKNLFWDIVQTTNSRLEQVSKLPFESLEGEAEINWTWIHGDVASHNFIQGENSIHMIDFDLLARSPQLYDYIQLGQRFLPHLDWDLDKLLEYRMVSDHHVKYWLLSLAVPSDVIREWLHFLSRDSSTSIVTYLNKMETEWVKRQDFLGNAISLLKLY